MMASGNVGREQLVDLLRGGNAHRRFEDAIEHFPIELMNAPLPDSDYTAWRLLEHMRIAQWDIVEFVRNAKHVSPPWPEGHWPPKGKVAGPPDCRQTIPSFPYVLPIIPPLADDPHTNFLR